MPAPAALALYLAAMAGPAPAPDPSPATPDNQTALTHAARCLLALSQLSESKEPAIKLAGTLGSMFFAGQVFGLSPRVDLTTLMAGELSVLEADHLGPALTDCGRELHDRGGELTRAGQALKAKGEEISRRNQTH